MPQVWNKNKKNTFCRQKRIFLPSLPKTIKTDRSRASIIFGNMPYRKQKFESGEKYHLILRALDDNLIFKDTDDYFRVIFCLYEFNNLKPVNISIRRRDRAVEKRREKPIEVGLRTIFENDKRDKLVNVLSFCFMPNHIHLLVEQIKDNGISKFMQKVGTGLAKYFNKKYQRKGHVFQDTFKSVHIEDDNQLMTVFNYIHVNPLSLIEPGWKEKGIKNVKVVIKFLENYKWSSYQDYIGRKNFPSVTDRDFLSEAMEEAGGCKNAIKNWLEYKKDIIKGNNLFLE